jgi:CHAD domain-containing protein
LIGTKTDLNTWDLLKNALRLSFGDQRNLDCLEQDLLTLFPFKNEPPLEFGKRIQIVRSKLESKLGSVSVTEMCINTNESLQQPIQQISSQNIYSRTTATTTKYYPITKSRHPRTSNGVRD